MHDNLQKEVDHLVKVLKQNGYPVNFISNLSSLSTKETANTSRHNRRQKEEKDHCYMVRISDGIRRACRKFISRVVKSGQSLCSMLHKVKDTLPLGKQSNVVY